MNTTYINYGDFCYKIDSFSKQLSFVILQSETKQVYIDKRYIVQLYESLTSINDPVIIDSTIDYDFSIPAFTQLDIFLEFSA